MAGDKTYITDGNGKLHRATRTHKVTPESIVWSSNPNDYAVQVRIDGKWHRAFLTMDAGTAAYFDNINIDKALVTGGDGKTHTVLICSPEASVTMSSIKTDQHSLVAGTTTGETAVNVYSETWSNVQWQDNVNVYKVLVTGSDGKVHTALLTTSVTGGVEVIIKGTSPLVLPDAIANSLSYVKAFGGTEQRNLPDNYVQRQYIYVLGGSYIRVEDLPISAGYKVEFDFQTTSLSTALRNYLGGRAAGVSAGGGFRLSKLSVSGSYNNNVVLYGFESGTEYYAPEQFQANTRYKYTYDNGVCKLESGGSVVSTRTFTVNDNTSTNWGINTYVTGSSHTLDADGIYVYSLKVWNDQGELVMDLVPAVQKGTVPVVGFYDTVTGGFRGPSGGTFAAGPEAAPTPDAPMDIVSNNGVLKARHQSGLPLGYTLLEYLESTGTQMIDLGLKWAYGTSTKTVCKMLGRESTALGVVGARNSASVVWGNFTNNSNTNYTCFGNVANVTFTQNMADGDYHTWETNNTGFYLDGVQKTNLSGSDQTLVSTDNIGLFGRYDGAGNIERLGKWQIKSHQTSVDNTLAQDLIPVKRNSDNVLGMYDLVSGQFFTNAGTGDFVAGNPVSDPVVAYADGTVETIGVHGKNLFNILTDDTGQGWYLTGTTVADSTANGTIVINCKPNTKYSFWHTEGSGGCRAFTMNKDTIVAGDTGVWATQSLTPTANANTVITTYTTPADAKKLYIMGYRSGVSGRTRADQLADLMVVEGEVATATAYEPYYNGGTATAEMLLKVDDYQDEQEIISGAVTRKVGVLVLDGTEAWSSTGDSYGAAIRQSDYGYLNSVPVLCSHFPYSSSSSSSQTDVICNRAGVFGLRILADSTIIPDNSSGALKVAGIKAFLAAQYAAGTPVIIVYPLETPTTESVAGQTLQVTGGDNVLEITQASLTGLELEAEYQAAVSLTIQEVEDANLDNNVTVIIQ